MTDTTNLLFVDPAETDRCFRVVLWAAPGEGKSVGAASAPPPLLVISADRPGAYRYARRCTASTPASSAKSGTRAADTLA